MARLTLSVNEDSKDNTATAGKMFNAQGSRVVPGSSRASPRKQQAVRYKLNDSSDSDTTPPASPRMTMPTNLGAESVRKIHFNNPSVRREMLPMQSPWQDRLQRSTVKTPSHNRLRQQITSDRTPAFSLDLDQFLTNFSVAKGATSSDTIFEDPDDNLASPSKLAPKSNRGPPMLLRPIDANLQGRLFMSSKSQLSTVQDVTTTDVQSCLSDQENKELEPSILPSSSQLPNEATADRPSTPTILAASLKLSSPNKRLPSIPTPPMRPSSDAFWDAETVNAWNDQHSPRKVWTSRDGSDNVSGSGTLSPQKLSSPSKRTRAEIAARRDWDSQKLTIATEFLAELDRIITENKISELSSSTGGIRVVWSKTLNSTAGRANWKREVAKASQTGDDQPVVEDKHFASIELAEKVIDDEERLLNVLAHEFCHLCNFMVSGIKDQPHGAQFKAWGRKVSKAFAHRNVVVTTKHTYQIDYKYIWQCSNDACAAEYKRHSRSIDPKRQTCGSCRSLLLQIKPVPRKGTNEPSNGFAGFVKEHFAGVKRDHPSASHKEIMELVAQKYHAGKASIRTPESSSQDEADEVHSELVKEVETEEITVSGSVKDDVDLDLDSVVRRLEFVALSDV